MNEIDNQTEPVLTPQAQPQGRGESFSLIRQGRASNDITKMTANEADSINIIQRAKRPRFQPLRESASYSPSTPIPERQRSVAPTG